MENMRTCGDLGNTSMPSIKCHQKPSILQHTILTENMLSNYTGRLVKWLHNLSQSVFFPASWCNKRRVRLTTFMVKKTNFCAYTFPPFCYTFNSWGDNIITRILVLKRSYILLKMLSIYSNTVFFSVSAQCVHANPESN